MDIANALVSIKKSFGRENVRLVAVSKTQPPALIEQAYAAGQRIFGENRVQELLPKYQTLPKDIEWHLIGTLQSNKVKFIAPFVALIHSVDSLKLLEAIDREAFKNKRIIDCLLQIYIAKEESKFGLDFEEALTLLKSAGFAALKNIRIRGLMGMATNTSDTDAIRTEFKSLYHFFTSLKQSVFKDTHYFTELSMGMSGDYLIAIEEGSTLVRIGTAIFRSFPPPLTAWHCL